MPKPRAKRHLVGILIVLSLVAPMTGAGAQNLPAGVSGVGALGRVEPRGGLIELGAGPADRLLRIDVKLGDSVKQGQVLAYLDTYPVQAAARDQAAAQLAEAQARLKAQTELSQAQAEQGEKKGEPQSRIARATAEERRAAIPADSLAKALAVAEARVAAATIVAPIGGTILAIHLHPGESTASRPILAMGDIGKMSVRAEVYETDIPRIKLGQSATMTSGALAKPLSGHVAEIGRMVSRNSVFSADPAARVDARIVPVWIDLDDSAEVAGLSNLTLDVVIAAPSVGPGRYSPGDGEVIVRVAWRILTHEIGRTALATIGIFVAILLVFIELGFFIAVPQGGLLIYSNMRFDLLLCSSTYVYQAQSGEVARIRLYQAMAAPTVARVTPLYFGAGRWSNLAGGQRSDIFVLGYPTQDPVFAVPDIERQRDVLDRPDTILVDSATRPSFGPLTTGQIVQIAGRAVTIGGRYDLGTGFLGLGVALVSEQNFFRLFPTRLPSAVNLGLVTLKRDADPDQAAAQLRAILPADTTVLTRDALQNREVAYWTTRTSTGLIFGSGLVVAFIVGIMVLYQTLSTQISRRLPEFATLKAMGYTDAALAGMVTTLALLIVVAAFVPAFAAALGIYSVIRDQTLLPVSLSTGRLGAVFGLTLLMAVLSAFLSLGALRRADPADVF